MPLLHDNSHRVLHPRRFSAPRRFPGHLITMRCRSISILDNDSFAEITITWARGVKQSRGVRATGRKEKEVGKKREEEETISRRLGTRRNDH